jgi:anaerobic magnesium-protoporphyrin IX monomethyl ester cyclase
MRVAIVIPPVRDFYFTPQRASFLGPRTLSEILRRNRVEHRVFNAVRGRGRPIPLPDELSYLSPYLGSRHFFSGYKRFGVEDEHMARLVADYHPEVILLSCFAFAYADDAISLAHSLKKALPNTPIFAGGAGISAHPEYFLRHSPIDYAVRGEVDASLVEMLNAPASFSDGGGIISDHAMSDPHSSFSPALSPVRESSDTCYYSTMISRGCPGRCSFCSVRLGFPFHRKSSLSDVDFLFRPLEGTRKKVHVNFEDDNLMLDFDYFAHVIGILDSHTGGNYSISMENGIDFTVLDRGKLSFLKNVNITRLNISFVSSNTSILARNKRCYNPEDFSEIAFTASSLSIPVTAYLLAGLPGESAKSVHEGIDFLARLPVLIGISPFYPVPGIDIYINRNFFDGISSILCRGTSFYPWGVCSTDELVHLFIRAREINLSGNIQS